MAPVEEMSVLDFDRSNKGASKQRRDQINAEIATMRDLLPLPESSRQRLSQLQIMSLTCVYVRKCNILHKLFRSKSQEKIPDSTDFFQALPAFVLVTTRDGKLLYISDNVTEYLGHSMVEMKTQGDSLYDIVDKRDHCAVQAQLLHGAPRHTHLGGTTAINGPDNPDSGEDVSFFCRMNMSRTLKRQSGFGDVKVMHVRGHFITVRHSEDDSLVDSSSSCVFMATCSPLITPDLKETLVQSNTMVFKTIHKLDMSFIEMTNNAEHHLGCNSEDLAGKSWYTVLHPEDIHQAKDKHMQLIHSNHEVGCMVTLRMLKADGTSFWVNSVMQIRQASLPQTDDAYIVCISQIIDENEAYQIKLHSHMFSVYPNRAHELWGSHLSTMTTGSSLHEHLQAGGTGPNHHWIQQDGTADLSMPSYHGNMSTSSMSPYQAQVGAGPHRMMPYQQSLSPQSAIMTGRHRHDATAQLNHPQPLVQTDQLKAMLKRKIKGPQQPQQHPDCKPLKIPRLDTLQDTDMWPGKKPGVLGMGSVYPTQYHPHRQQQQQLSSFQHMPYSEQSVQLMQVMQPECYVFGTKPSVGLGFKRVLPTISSTDSSLALMGSEQVVPDVNVPESFLTPEPSPASSPQPAASLMVKGTRQSAYCEKGSFTILQALEKLAALPHQLKSVSSALEEVKVVPPTCSIDSSQVTQRKTELPIFDAFDIDTFFDALEPPVGKSKESPKMKQVQVKEEIKTEDSTTLSPSFGCNLDQVFVKCEALSPPSSVPSMSPEHAATAQALPVHNYHQQQQIKLKSELLTASSCMKLFTRSQPNVTSVSARNLSIQEKVAISAEMSPLQSSSCPKQESLDDLLHYFSVEGADLCPLHIADSTQFTCKSSASSDVLLNEDHFQLQQQRREHGNSPGNISSLVPSEFPKVMPSKPHSPTSEMKPQHCRDNLSPPCMEELSPEQQLNRKAEELSPASSVSSLAGDDELLEERAAFTFDLALEMLDTQGQDEKAPLSIKDSDVLSFSDELGFILESLVPSDNALEMIKHGQ